MFGRLFGAKGGKGGGSSGSTPPPSGGGGGGTAATQTINAIQNLADKEEQLEKRKDLLEKKIAGELEKAKTFSTAKKKSQALMCLKRKKMYEQQIENVENQMLRITEQRMQLESSQTTAGVVQAMQAAASAQKATLKEVKIENVDMVMDEIQEQNDQMRQVNDALSAPMMNDLDEDELLGELEELEQNQLEEQLLEPGVPATKVPGTELPAVPQTTAATPGKTQEELELEELQKEMGLAA